VAQQTFGHFVKVKMAFLRWGKESGQEKRKKYIFLLKIKNNHHIYSLRATYTQDTRFCVVWSNIVFFLNFN